MLMVIHTTASTLAGQTNTGTTTSVAYQPLESPVHYQNTEITVRSSSLPASTILLDPPTALLPDKAGCTPYCTQLDFEEQCMSVHGCGYNGGTTISAGSHTRVPIHTLFVGLVAVALLMFMSGVSAISLTSTTTTSASTGLTIQGKATQKDVSKDSQSPATLTTLPTLSLPSEAGKGQPTTTVPFEAGCTAYCTKLDAGGHCIQSVCCGNTGCVSTSSGSYVSPPRIAALVAFIFMLGHLPGVSAAAVAATTALASAPASSSASNCLSGGAIAGIVVGSFVGGLIFGGITKFCGVIGIAGCMMCKDWKDW